MLNGLQNFLSWIDENWTSILVVIGLCIGLWKKIDDYLGKSTEEKIAIAKNEITNAMLKMISDSQKDYASWKQSGEIKRSQVIRQIYKEYPILSKVADQDTLIEWIDEQIDNSLVELRKVIKENTGVTSLADAEKAE